MNEDTPLSRREFLRTSSAAGVAVAAGAGTATVQGEPPESEKPGQKDEPVVLPRRKLGRTGVEVTILGQGAAFAITERLLNMMHSLGIRYIDTAAYYLQGNAERTIGKWLNKTGYRKEYFLVDKDLPLTPEQMEVMIDRRLKILQTDYLDLFLLGAMGDTDHYHGLADTKWFTDKKWITAVERIRRSGKCHFFGFSTHSEPIDVRSGMLSATAKGGWVDAVMVSADPVVLRENAAFAAAIDACHKAGVGLISMKQTRGGPGGVQRVLPSIAEKGLNAHTAVLTAMWTDERFSSVCSHMDNVTKLHENANACKNFKPLTDEELGTVGAMLRGAKRTYCLGCDGSCRRAAGTRAKLNTIARYVSYAEDDDRVCEARQWLLNLSPEACDWSGADLDAARRACKCHLDFASIVKLAEELMV